MISVSLTGNAHALKSQMAAQQHAFKHGYEEVMRTVAISTAHSLLRHSYPAVGNEPWNGQGNTAGAKEQGEYNLRRDIESIFYPVTRHSVRELAMSKDPVLWQLGNPIEWRDPQLKQAWESRDMEVMFNTFATRGTDVGEQDVFNYEITNFASVEAQKVNYVATPTSALHDRAKVNGAWDRKTRYAVRDKTAIENYISQQLRNIGRSANGWIDCIKQLGSQVGQALPGKGSGSVKIDRAGGSISYTLENVHGDPNGMITKNQVLTKVMAEEQQKMTELYGDLMKRVAAVKPGQAGTPPALPPPLPPPLPTP